MIRKPLYNNADFNKYFYKFCDETSRACAILGCAYLDNLLNELLKARLVEDKKLFKDFVDRLTFDRRITLSCLVGLINQDTKEDLKIINKIRGEFAHDIDLDDFNQKTCKLDIPCELDKLRLIQKEKKHGAPITEHRDKYILAVAAYMFRLDSLLQKCPRISRVKKATK